MKVTTATAKHILVADWLKENGHEAVTIGDNTSIGSEVRLGVRLNADVSRRHSLLWFRWTSETYCDIARIWISNPDMGARSKNWVIQVFGRENMAFVETLAHELAESFNVDIHVRLEQVQSREILSSFI